MLKRLSIIIQLHTVTCRQSTWPPGDRNYHLQLADDQAFLAIKVEFSVTKVCFRPLVVDQLQ